MAGYDLALLAATSVASAILVVLLLRPGFWTSPRASRLAAPISGDAVFLLDGETLLDATPQARALIGGQEGSDDWALVAGLLRRRFPGFPETPEILRNAGRLILPARSLGDRGEVLAEWLDGIARIHIRSRQTTPDTVGADRVHWMEQELSTLRLAMDQAPFPAWILDDDEDRILWHNTAYSRLADAMLGDTPDPGRRLFASSLDKGEGGQARVSVSRAGSETGHWYDLTMVRIDGRRLFYATNVDAVVSAEVAQRNFVQTLAKTFAQLSTGLAIFDRNRQLALFNPALIDLTALPADFLSSRPTLPSFFDRLRDARIMPEPKDYGSWREQMAALVAAAADGSYVETWSLPAGATYRISGRPHPDGAIAFLIEDITAEVTLTRRFRSDLELGQSLIDTLDDAMVVFTRSGTLSLSNAAYRDMWNTDPEASFADVTVVDATRLWSEHCEPTPVWGDLRDFVRGQEHRTDWQAEIRLRSGEALQCRVFPLQGGATLLIFRQADPVAPAPETIACESA